ncbi:L-threonylcarbamoyladenylate synthase [Rhodoflexus sp.]
MIGTSVDTAAAHLQAGEVVAIPTETVYGLAGNALFDKALATIFQVKNRPQFDPLIVHIADAAQVSRYATDFPEKARQLAAQFWPGPLTLLLPKKDIIPDLCTSGLPRVALRVPNHPLTLELLKKLPFPLAAPSANPFGYISPTTAQHVADQLGDKIPYILDGGNCNVGIESTIIGFEEDEAVVYRKGGLSVEAIEAVIGKVRVMQHSTSQPAAPGMLKSHYAPRIPVVLGNLDELLKQAHPQETGILSFQKKYNQIPDNQQVILSATGDYAEAAQRFFAALRYLDSLPLSVIFAELLPEEGLGRAINDRLRRAAAH